MHPSVPGGYRSDGVLVPAEPAGKPAAADLSALFQRRHAELVRMRVVTALAGLPFRRREVLVLRYYVGLSEAEIASMLGISTGTVKSTAARGLAALARRLGGEV